MKKWSKNLKYVQAIENVMIYMYLYKSCHWGEQGLRNYKSNNGYRLHRVNHIIDDEVG